MQRRSRIGGFTLIEVLVSVGILGLILTALTAGVGFAGRAWTTQELRLARNGDMDSVISILRQLIAQGRGFQGGAETLGFVAPLPDALAKPGLFECELRLSAERLVLAWRPRLKTEEIASFTVTELASHVAGVKFRYFAADTDGKNTWVWRDSVNVDEDPPRLISLTVATTDGHAVPPLVVAPAIEREPGGER